jgi:uncharacterized DUF497 family protein
MLKSGVAGYNFGENRAMEFEWDEDKRLANLGKHGVDFGVAEILFDGRPQVSTASPRHEEL